ncbi:sigma 54-interacting transcriptional regulator [Edwardsiella piscicida]|uniref:Sigma 54-interacting transcriptional regulator n=1 Tax=Edwardsiella piscicida TaxID=1263550 RepID=A0AAQ3C5A0_EDWPI|nr:sigma 54-interacting transcriptional regulator [Edwardsiella piscicida]UJT84184.1 sigma 54-interacting transcriptional regulator [Edwardsiella piscicida]UJT87454.1 sigma 54-interacting transcriptional regulator [Edwardsiella piscicida]WDU92726.1 sigma 54-interacting transcriptional regulator [Edwardsiella piscicida]WGS82189.1 sigma 54-interacting transcriptional regulator [Edwardsiella piscicida]WLJ45087.1 sigma 54-interacting transcriptional regulator [Edwardsiella piscicida]
MIDGAFDSVARQVSCLPKEIAAVISRGGTAEKIRLYTHKPVVSIETSALDLLALLLPLRGQAATIGVISYRQPLPGVELIAQALGMRICQDVFHSREDIDALLQRDEMRNLDIIVGGILVVRAAQRLGVNARLLTADEDAIHRALQQAILLAQAEDESRHKAAQLDTMLSTIAEALIVTDDQDRIIQVNPAALKILQCEVSEVMGLEIRSLIPDSQTQDVLRSQQSQLGQVLEVKGETFVANRVPIISQGRSLGVVCTLSASRLIRHAEHRLREKERLRQGFVARYNIDDILTSSPKMQALKTLVLHYAATQANVLIQGESGTGKELFAQSIHRNSSRSHRPFVAINCAAIPENLLESELFGYVDGAFTGATRKGKAGLFELAHGGTLFLDEIGELPLNMQTKLLRVLQEKEIMRIGSNEVVPVDVRIITATNQDLQELIGERLFRNDLYYRLNTLHIQIPPLRSRDDDLCFLGRRFLQEMECSLAEPQEKALLVALCRHPFNGNVRELRAIMERFSILYRVFPALSPAQLLQRYCLTEETSRIDEKNGAEEGEVLTCQVPLLDDFKLMTHHCQCQIIQHYLDKNQQNHQKVAQQLKISKMSIYRHLR